MSVNYAWETDIYTKNLCRKSKTNFQSSVHKLKILTHDIYATTATLKILIEWCQYIIYPRYLSINEGTYKKWYYRTLR